MPTFTPLSNPHGTLAGQCQDTLHLLRSRPPCGGEGGGGLDQKENTSGRARLERERNDGG